MIGEDVWQEDGDTLAARKGPYLMNVWLDGELWHWDVCGLTEDTDDDLREGTARTEFDAMSRAELACRELRKAREQQCPECGEWLPLTRGPIVCPNCGAELVQYEYKGP